MYKVWEVFWRFLALGCVSFGGPAAHIGYFQKVFVEKLQWLNLESYSKLIALSQFLPGPGSSQIGFSIGLQRAGFAGGIAAFIGFSTPSFLLLFCLASFGSHVNDNMYYEGIIYGLKLFAVIVVTDAVMTMFRNFCKEKLAIGIAVATSASLLIMPGVWIQIGVLVIAAVTGMSFHKTKNNQTVSNKSIFYFPFILFLLLFIGLPVFASVSPWLEFISSFYQSGSLVFGGGHVVLPLLQQTLGENISNDRFLVGYAAAQAVPGPMFTMASFLGTELSPGTPFTGALLATLAIFLPGFLLVLSLKDAWESLASKPKIASAVWGINASVVGLLIAALYQPVFISAVHSPLDMALVIIGFYTLNILRVPIVGLVISFALIGVLLNI